jgi:hypothetical protein
MPPQSFLFPITDIALAFWKTASVGTSPTKLLNEIFKCSRIDAFCRSLGMIPEKLFHERSASFKSFKVARDEGKFPSNELPCK